MAFNKNNVCICCRRRHSGAAGNEHDHNNKNSNKNNHNNNNCIDSGSILKILQHCQLHNICIYAVLMLMLCSVAIREVHCATVSLNMDLLNHPNFEPLCTRQQEHFIESDGKESSLILEFKPGVFGETQKSCTRILSAPPSYGFIMRLILPKLRHHANHINSGKPTSAPTKSIEIGSAVDVANGNGDHAGMDEGSNSGGDSSSAVQTPNAGVSTLIEKLNTTTSLKSITGRNCPLTVFSSLDPHTPQWRVDPCQLEDTAPEMEDPVRLFHGRVRIVWEHGQHTLKSKLMVTALGKGEQCLGGEKHQCLRIGDEPLLCISKDLVCDGIRHCPISNEYDSDEDYGMCWKRRRFGEPLPVAMESDIFEHFALEVFRNLFAYDAPNAPETTSAASDINATNSTTLRKVHTKDMKKHESDNNGVNTIDETEPKVENNTDTNGSGGAGGAGSGFSRRNSTRSGLHSDLSKYGPWGYLMLGMLLCGGALLICGLWASASQHAVNNEREAALAAAAVNGHGGEQSGTSGPPNYEELDPPPAYSVLFPNQKAASSNTLNALEPQQAATSGAASLVATQPTAGATSIIRVQLESTAPSSSQQLATISQV